MAPKSLAARRPGRPPASDDRFAQTLSELPQRLQLVEPAMLDQPKCRPARFASSLTRLTADIARSAGIGMLDIVEFGADLYLALRDDPGLCP